MNHDKRIDISLNGDRAEAPPPPRSRNFVDRHARFMAKCAAVLAVMALLAPLVVSPAYAAGVGKIRAVAAQLLEELGVTSGGTYSGFTGTLTDTALTLSNTSANVGDLTIQHTPGTGAFATIDLLDLRQNNSSKRLVLSDTTYAETFSAGADISTGDLTANADILIGKLNRVILGSNVELDWDSTTGAWAESPDLFLGRSSAGVLRVGATTGTADGDIQASVFDIQGISAGPVNGIYQSSTNRVSFNTGSVRAMEITNLGPYLGSTVPIIFDTTVTPDGINGDTFLGRSSAGVVYVGATNGTADGTVKAAQFRTPNALDTKSVRLEYLEDANWGPSFLVQADDGGDYYSALVAAAVGVNDETNDTSYMGVFGNAADGYGTGWYGVTGNPRFWIPTEAGSTNNNYKVMVASNGEYCFTDTASSANATPDTFLGRSSAGVLRVGATTGTADGEVHADNFVAGDDGAASDPPFRGSDADSGIFFDGSGANLNIVRNGGTVFNVAAKTNFQGQGVRINDDISVAYGAGDDVLVQGELTTLTDGTATTVFSVVMGDGDLAGITVDYTIQSTDGSDYVVEQGRVFFAIIDRSAGITAATPSETSLQALEGPGPGPSMTSTWSVVTTDDQSIELQVNADVDFTPSTHVVRWKATFSGDVTLSVP